MSFSSDTPSGAGNADDACGWASPLSRTEARTGGAFPMTEQELTIVDIVDEQRRVVEQYFEQFKYLDNLVGDAIFDIKSGELELPKNIRRHLEDAEAGLRHVRYWLEDWLVVLSK
jgi:hypothetical protein